MSEERVKVLYIGGYSRSGSTLLLRLLGQMENFVGVGEVWDIWQRSFDENQLCGCGQPFRTCEFWQAVVAQAFGGFEQVDVAAMQALRRSVQSNHHIPFLALPFLRPPEYTKRLNAYTDILGKLYEGIHQVSGGRVIVDSSKVPPYAFVLNQVANVDLHIVHLVRDSRATAYSWQRKKIRPEIHWQTAYMDRYSPVRSALEWDVMNGLLHALKHSGANYMRIRYEELVHNPRQSILRILADLDQEPPDMNFFDNGHAVRLGVNHIVSGNPNRFQQGTVKIRPDIEWQEKMARGQKHLVTVLTWPLLLNYGYSGRNKSAKLTGFPWLWPAILFFSVVAVAVVTFGNVVPPLRPFIAFWFLLVCPGMAFVHLLRLKESFAEWTLAIALSLALDAIVAGSMLYAGMWSPNWGLIMLIGISLVGAALQIAVAYGR